MVEPGITGPPEGITLVSCQFYEVGWQSLHESLQPTSFRAGYSWRSATIGSCLEATMAG